MIDHIELRTCQVQANVVFYTAVLAPLGYTQTVDGKAKGFGDASGSDFFLVTGELVDQAHYAFRCADCARVAISARP